jgi:hypothetical protein
MPAIKSSIAVLSSPLYRQLGFDLSADFCCACIISLDDALHGRLLDLLTRYNVNDYAASVRVFAVKP